MGDERFRLRIRYTKGGRLKYLSHLEVVRCMERCIRRAGLPFMVSQGFSPHMRTAFGWALPVGVAGLDEYLDVLMHEYVAPNRVVEALRGVTPRGIEVLDVFYIDPRAKAPDAEYPFSLYECVFAATEGEKDGSAPSSPDETLAVLEAALDELLAVGHMIVKRKKKEKTVVFEGLLPERPTFAIADDARVAMRMLTFTEGKGSLRPDLFCAEILQRAAGVELKSIARLEQRSAD
ncbi:MAG: TIGR03936 family radical SAM-associated protein [Coriobacteriales bacterium]